MGKVKLMLHMPGSRGDCTTYPDPTNIKLREHNLIEFVFQGKKHTSNMPFEITEELASDSTTSTVPSSGITSKSS